MVYCDKNKNIYVRLVLIVETLFYVNYRRNGYLSATGSVKMLDIKQDIKTEGENIPDAD